MNSTKPLEPEFIIYTTDNNNTKVALSIRDGKLWLSQKQLIALYKTTKQNISAHIHNILKDGILLEKQVVNEYLTVLPDGKTYSIIYYSLEMILALGYRIHSVRSIEFRKWAMENLKEHLIKDLGIDSEGLRNPNDTDVLDEIFDKKRRKKKAIAEGKQDIKKLGVSKRKV